MGELTACRSGRAFAWPWLLHSMQSKCLAVLIHIQINTYFIRAKNQFGRAVMTMDETRKFVLIFTQLSVHPSGTLRLPSDFLIQVKSCEY